MLPPLCNENLLSNEVIREYFQFNCYHCSTSVLVTGEKFLNMMSHDHIVIVAYTVLSNFDLKQIPHDQDKSVRLDQFSWS